MLRKRYKIWCIQHNVNKPGYGYIIAENGNWAYPLDAILSVMADRWNREDVVSIDPSKLEGSLKYLNEMAFEDQHYEIREELVEF